MEFLKLKNFGGASVMNLNTVRFSALLALLLLFGSVSAGVQISSYNVTPSVLRPGMSGNVLLTINNPSATEYISGAYVDASAPNFIFVSKTTNIGDIGAQSTTLVTVPFKVSGDAQPGSAIMSFVIGYTSSVSGTSGYKTFSIPVSVTTPNILQISSVSSSVSPINPGDAFVISAVLTNAGENDLRNLVLSYASDAKFTFDGSSKIVVGDINKEESRNLEIPILASTSATAGYYSIAFTATYDDAATAANSEQLLFGPVTVVEAGGKIAVSADAGNAGPGSTAELKIKVKNTGNSDLFGIKVMIPQNSSFFVPLDYAQNTIPDLKAGEEKTVSFSIGINSDALSQVYPVALTITYQGKTIGSETVSKTVGVKLSSKSDISVILKTVPAPVSVGKGQYSLSLQVSNTGDAGIRALYVSAFSDALEFLSGSEDYIGTLSIDDYSTVQFPIIVKSDLQPGNYPVTVTLVYKNSYNEQITEQKELVLEVVSPEVAALASKTNGGSNTTTTVIIAVVVIGIGYFAYTRFFKKKKHAAVA